MSAYFGNHAVSYFFEPVLVNHDRDRLSIFCYSDVGQPDAYTHRMRGYPCVWRDIAGQSDEAVAQLIASDEIDILVDLSGHIAEHRLLVFARKPAPVQVTWNGYPNTTGVRLEQAFAGHGVGAERLELAGRLPFQQFLAAHQRVDVALDPFPFNGTTTTCQTLWMGVPLITLAGRSHVARVGVSMLSNLGLERLIARDEREYVSLAVALAQDDEELATLRAGLRERMLASPNTDGARLTRFLEAAYAKMWKDYCLRTDS